MTCLPRSLALVSLCSPLGCFVPDAVEVVANTDASTSAGTPLPTGPASATSSGDPVTVSASSASSSGVDGTSSGPVIPPGTTADGSTTNGSTTNGSTTNGSTTNGSTTNGSTTDGEGESGSSGAPPCQPAVPTVCGRGPNGLECGLSDGMGDFVAPALTMADFDDMGGWNGDMHHWLTIQYPDIDGDGTSDVCARGNGGVICGLGDGLGGIASLSVWAFDYTNAAGWTDDSRWSTVAFPDLDGDGSHDICGRDSDGVRCGLSNSVDGFVGVSLWTTAMSDLDGWNATPDHWGTIQFADIDGDGNDDLCGRATTGVWCSRSDGAAFGPLEPWALDFSDAVGWNQQAWNWGTIRFPDLDGDGDADICARAFGGLSCFLSDGIGFNGGMIVAPEFSNANGWTADSWWGTLGFPDLDGDGGADVCGRSAQGLQCTLFDGAAFSPVSQWSPEYGDAGGWGQNQDRWATIQYVDIDGDGDHDVCGRSPTGLFCARSNGVDGFTDYHLAVNAFTDAAGWTAPSRWRTIRFAVASPGDCGPEPVAMRAPWGTSALAPRD